jgi:hypothetical protein
MVKFFFGLILEKVLFRNLRFFQGTGVDHLDSWGATKRPQYYHVDVDAHYVHFFLPPELMTFLEYPSQTTDCYSRASQGVFGSRKLQEFHFS